MNAKDEKKFRNNHYVPQWYQKRFVPLGQTDQELYYLDLKPEVFITPTGHEYMKNNPQRLGFKFCFAEEDLYTTWFGSEFSTEIEEAFFGKIDRDGAEAINAFTDFSYANIRHEIFRKMIRYLSTQKLRTPKGLGLLEQTAGTSDRNALLKVMVKLRDMYCAIWTECVWQIADASLSNTKFIVSDHPVTVYNRACGPKSQLCKGLNDPDIWLQATQTIFPLSFEKVLIMTNLSWVRNPYQKETKSRPNPFLFRQAIFKILDIQFDRKLNEQEVREINFIIKSRALHYIAAGKKEWLYPEEFVTRSDWFNFGHGYLLMPDPRGIHAGGELLWGNYDGTGGAIDPYGRRPWQKDYNKESDSGQEFRSLYRFKGEFARLFGPYRRGRSFELGSVSNAKDSDKSHKYHLNLEEKFKRKYK
jgi:hypothetical protein